MNKYEVYIEIIDPCGGEKDRKRELIEVSAESPVAFVQSRGKWPIMDSFVNASGDHIFICHDGCGNIIRYTFLL